MLKTYFWVKLCLWIKTTILYAKQYFFHCLKSSIVPNLHGFIGHLKMYYNVEKFTSEKNLLLITLMFFGHNGIYIKSIICLLESADFVSFFLFLSIFYTNLKKCIEFLLSFSFLCISFACKLTVNLFCTSWNEWCAQVWVVHAMYNTCICLYH